MEQIDIATRDSDHPTAPPARTVAVVLAGGEGQRMGGSKPLRALGKTTLLAQALKLARAYCPTVAVSVRNPDQLAGAADAELLVDPQGLLGPLAGLAAGLAFARREGATHVLTLPCDTPRLPADLRSRLEAVLEDDGGLAKVAVASSGGHLHPTCALWSTDALEPLLAYAASGRRSLNGLAGALCMAIVEWDAGEADPFANANTPDELAALQSDGRDFGY
jgi:molybdopterin-guanine dinucleotide biosynthesis protein A